jgi:uncharacterized protein
VPQDYTQALQWYRKPAEQGNARGQFSLGVMYANGRGVPQDYTQAVRWYRSAAEQGNARGQFRLGAMYAEGDGAPQDYVEAYKWETLAAARGSAGFRKRFADRRDELAKKMTPGQIGEGQKRAREWTAAFEQDIK